MRYYLFAIIAVALVAAIGLVYINSRGGSELNPLYTNSEAEKAGTAEVIPNEETKSESINTNQNMNQQLVTIETNYGTIKFKTYESDAPKTVQNFVTLANKGFYNGVIFHRVISGFMIQGGDPSGNGTGGPGYKFEDELNPSAASYKEGYKKGVVAMANAGPNTNGSQFFIMLEDYPLPNLYTIFGKVVEGQDVVDAIGKVATDANDKPLKPVVMQNVMVTTE